MNGRPELERSIGFLGATGVGVGAIVGGGILALTGVAFAVTGPAAILAFALNGSIALITALSFAELATRFPESGGAYAFAKKVLPIEAAFLVGWVVWFASIAAAALYAFGFGAFAIIAIDDLTRSLDRPLPAWTSGKFGILLLAGGAVSIYTLGVLKTKPGGGHAINVGKVVVFCVLIAAGLWAVAGTPAATIGQRLSPFFTAGSVGLLQAMGFTFIAMQGFDLIAAMGGEVRNPTHTIPRAMLCSLGIALLIYLPLLFIIAIVGVSPGQSVAELAAQQPAAIVAIAARNFLGSFGYWLVIAAGILSMLTALRVNLLAASRIGMAMARDRNLPHWIEVISPRHRAPTAAVVTTSALVIVVLLSVPDLAQVGAAASLVFLITFALAHRVAILARRRGSREHSAFRMPGFPVIPWVGAGTCLGLAAFQGIAVPSAGIITCIWLVLGGMLYMSAFARRARTMDAATQALDAELVRLRGRSPLVLVPISNPRNAEAMVGVANALAPPRVGRVLLLSVVTPPDGEAVELTSPSLAMAESVLRQTLCASFARSLMPEVLTTISSDPWIEIVRVAGTFRCESLLVGLSESSEPSEQNQLDKLMRRVPCDAVVLRAPAGWLLRDVRSVLVPIGGRRMHNELRARLLASIHRLGAREITLLKIVPQTATDDETVAANLALLRIARDEVPFMSESVVTKSDDVAEAIAKQAEMCDLLVLGTQSRSLGELAIRVAERTTCALIMISSHGADRAR